MEKAAPPLAALQEEYRQLFELARIRPKHAVAVDGMVERIFKPEHWERYQAVQARTQVPAHVVGIIHSLETGLDFNRHLHNGDPLTARTVHAPAGRPETGDPPFAWEASASDALLLKKLDQVPRWSVPAIAHALEGYNGWGYRFAHPQVKSPYLWSLTTVYTSGKYIKDHVWSDAAVSRQCGGMALLRRMVETGRVTAAGCLPAANDDAADVREECLSGNPLPRPGGQCAAASPPR